MTGDTYSTYVYVDSEGECVVPIPEEILREAGIDEGDDLEIEILDDGTVTLRRVED